MKGNLRPAPSIERLLPYDDVLTDHGIRRRPGCFTMHSKHLRFGSKLISFTLEIPSSPCRGTPRLSSVRMDVLLVYLGTIVSYR